jgi:predicted RNase H-like nuclease (RuvC/YqgF family)
MRRSVGIVLGVITVLLLGATVVTYSKYRKSASDYAQATANEESMRQRYDGAVSEIVMIQDSLNTIVLGGESVLPAGQQLEGPGTLHDTVLSRIATLKASVERTKDRIEELDAKLKRGGVKIAGLEKMIAGLRKSASEKEERIAQLSTQVDTLQTQVAGLNTEVQTKQQDIELKQQELTEKQHELATIFYTMGTKKELTRSGVIASKGGVLGFGKTLKPTGTVNESSFTPLDTDEETVIRIPAEKAQVLSAQPIASYTIQPISKDVVELRIVDPKEFRKVKHLVILKA